VTLNIGMGLIKQVCEMATRAGEEIMEVYRTDFAVEAKDDNSPVTEADRRAEALITDAIRAEITDAFPIVGEEAVSEGHAPNVTGQPFWLIDPLDGTKEFVKRGKEFTVNIALIEIGLPMLGVVHLPATGDTFWGSRYGSFATVAGGAPRQIACRAMPSEGIVAMVSRSHKTPEVDKYLADLKIGKEISAGSSMKFCRVAMGQADLYPRFGRTMEWDTAAGHAVVRFAGGRVCKTDGTELMYGKPEFENPDFIVSGAETQSTN
jgi:3'(2'), 5'-bisphosphate nucleotidase